jgi:hypothetical protein
MLANDMTLISQTDVPRALLSPGSVRISSNTFSLLPHYSNLQAKYPRISSQYKASIPRIEFVDNANPLFSAPIKFILFPTVGAHKIHQLTLIPRAIGLARLLEASLDQWDQGTWENHIGFLENLSHEIEFYELRLGHDMSVLPRILEQSLM